MLGGNTGVSAGWDTGVSCRLEYRGQWSGGAGSVVGHENTGVTVVGGIET